jgi:hypothetical protein
MNPSKKETFDHILKLLERCISIFKLEWKYYNEWKVIKHNEIFDIWDDVKKEMMFTRNICWCLDCLTQWLLFAWEDDRVDISWDAVRERIETFLVLTDRAIEKGYIHGSINEKSRKNTLLFRCVFSLDDNLRYGQRDSKKALQMMKRLALPLEAKVENEELSF